MPTFSAVHEETRTLSLAPEAAAAHFADLDQLIAATDKVVSAEKADGVIHFVLEEEDHQVLKIQPDYKCRYVLDGTTVRWETLEGNPRQSGTATFKAHAHGSSMDYREEVALDLDVPAMMAPMLKPVIGAMLAGEMKSFVKKMATSAS